MLNTFAAYAQQLESDSEMRDRIRTVTKDIDVNARMLQSHIAALHVSTTPEAVQAVVTQIDAQVALLRQQWPRLNAVVGAGQFFRFKGSWQNSIRDAVTVVVLRHWLANNELLSLEAAAALLGIVPAAQGEAIDAVTLELEDFLFGVASVTAELSRLAVNAVTHGDFELPVRIGAFVSALYNAFRLINFKNDFLRRKYDSIKYDNSRIEGVLYDLRIRNLVQGNAQAPGVAAAAAAAIQLDH
jgi:predicted translin family RNA/ssDNA-binding protein